MNGNDEDDSNGNGDDSGDDHDDSINHYQCYHYYQPFISSLPQIFIFTNKQDSMVYGLYQIRH